MSDIVQKARELIDGIGAGECGPVGSFVDSISNLLERIQELEQERDAALERVRVLGSSIKAFLDFRGLICGPEYHALVLGLTQALSKLEGRL